ncbi:diguanylate cyclase domain-containing protein [Alicyclobacillus sp. SO9]|uniref:diguanylate cyclase domain-containing protein n=1 Tax=Alicyclobacillus sp. SO9 TaxID=2665646 RepID=UPI001E61D049|nr:diguanylate cyclase [Alicyclobacillus sp. SO9]
MRDLTFDYKSLFNQATAVTPDAVILLNHEGQALHVNEAFHQLYGWTLQELNGMDVLPFISDDKSTLRKALVNLETVESTEDTHMTKDGCAIQLSINCKPVRYDEERPHGLIAVMHDITGQKAIHSVIERTAEPVFIHHHGAIIYMNQACAELLKAKQPSDLLDSHIFDFIHEDFVDLMQERTKRCYMGEEVDAVDIKIIVEDEVLWVTVSPNPVLFQGKHCTQVSLRDVTMQYDRQQLLEEWAYHDVLTGLPNRRYFIASAEKKLSNWQEANTGDTFNEHQLVVMSLDCDDFKQINDTLGHEVGDQVLKKIGRVIEQTVRETDTVARMGGDEFLILFELEQDERELHRIVNDLLTKLNQAWNFGTNQIEMRVSYGLAYHRNGETLHELINRADRDLYKMKRKRLIERFQSGQHTQCAYSTRFIGGHP